MWSYNSENHFFSTPNFGSFNRIVVLLLSKHYLYTGRYTCMYLQTHIHKHIYRKRYVCRDLSNLSGVTFGSERAGEESESPFRIGSSVESHGVPWHGVSFSQQREVAAFSLRNSFCILHKHIKVSWNLCILCEIHPPYLKTKFHPYTIFRF